MIAFADSVLLREHLIEHEDSEECALSPEGNEVADKWLRGLLALLFLWMAWLSLVVINIDKNLAVIEGNRFTSKDGIAVMERMLEEVKAIHDEIESHERDRTIHPYRYEQELQERGM